VKARPTPTGTEIQVAIVTPWKLRKVGAETKSAKRTPERAGLYISREILEIRVRQATSRIVLYIYETGGKRQIPVAMIVDVRHLSRFPLQRKIKSIKIKIRGMV
jgi:hypothetical protein